MFNKCGSRYNEQWLTVRGVWLSEGGGNPYNVWWNDVVKVAVERNEVLGVRDETA